jgi:RimJ/RimL family protein N-acetyltransferase
MTSPHILTALAAERRKTLIAHARQRRQYQQAQAASGKPERRPTNPAILIRPIDVGDEALVTDGFTRLSARSRWLRFLGSKTSLSPAELHDLTHVNHADNEALVAVSEEDGRGIGLARYVRDKGDPHTAEIAVAVIDDWHRRGVGTELVARLIERAEAEGIHRLTALIAHENAATINLLYSLNLEVAVIDRHLDTAEYQITLAAP